MKFDQTHKSQLLMLAVSISLLSGCATDNQADNLLKDRVAKLEAENQSLKLQLQKAQATATAADTTKTSSASGDDGVKNEEAVEQITYTDLGDNPSAEMITELGRLKVFDDTGNLFKPDETITRAEYCRWLYNAHNAIMPESKQLRLATAAPQTFKDCSPVHPDYKYVQALANAGYSIGYDDGTFKPDQPLTREEMIGIKLGVDVGKKLDPWRSQMEAVWKFSDGKQVGERFTGYVHQDFYVSGPRGSNIQRAFGKVGAFRPKQPVLRSEAAATLWQIGQFGDTQKTTAAAVLKEKGGKT